MFARPTVAPHSYDVNPCIDGVNSLDMMGRFGHHTMQSLHVPLSDTRRHLAAVADRRAQLRFEIVGRLRGTIASHSTVQLRDISRGGALVESPWPLQLDTVHAVRLESHSQFSQVDACVRHVRPAVPGPNHYLIGLEFVSPDAPASQHLALIVGDRSGNPDRPA